MDSGATIPTWAGRRAQDALTRVKANGRANRTPCALCTQRIDYSLTYPHPMSCSVQHIKSRHHWPELTWDPTNHAPAHLTCNQQAGAGHNPRTGVAADLGVTSQHW